MKLLHTGAIERTVLLDPRTKLVLLVSVSTVLLTSGNGPLMTTVRTVMLVAPFILLAVSGRFGTAAGLLGAYAASLALTSLVVPNVEGPLNFLIVASCMIASRFIPTIATAYFVFATTTVSEFMAAMDRMHAPQFLTLPLAVLFRFFPTLSEEARAINGAMRMRSVNVRSSGLLAMVEYRLVPLMSCAVQIGEDLSAASLTRGFGSPERRTSLCDVGFQWLDALVMGACLVSVGLLVAATLGLVEG